MRRNATGGPRRPISPRCPMVGRARQPRRGEPTSTRARSARATLSQPSSIQRSGADARQPLLARQPQRGPTFGHDHHDGDDRVDARSTRSRRRPGAARGLPPAGPGWRPAPPAPPRPGRSPRRAGTWSGWAWRGPSRAAQGRSAAARPRRCVRRVGAVSGASTVLVSSSARSVAISSSRRSRSRSTSSLPAVDGGVDGRQRHVQRAGQAAHREPGRALLVRRGGRRSRSPGSRVTSGGRRFLGCRLTFA